MITSYFNVELYHKFVLSYLISENLADLLIYPIYPLLHRDPNIDLGN
jgi:hypothetical protein